MNQEQTIKINNWKAQYNNLLSSINIANKQLEDLFISQSNIEDKIKESFIELYNKRQETKKATENKQNIIYSLNIKISELEKEASRIQKNVDSKNKSLKKIEVNEKKLEVRISELDTSIIEKNIELSFITGIVKDTNNLLSETKLRLESRKKEEKKLDKAISELIQKCHNNEMKFKKEYSSQTQILKDIKQEIKEEKDKIKSPRELLKLEETELDKKERNLNTLIRRFKKYYSKTFPDRELNI